MAAVRCERAEDGRAQALLERVQLKALMPVAPLDTFENIVGRILLAARPGVAATASGDDEQAAVTELSANIEVRTLIEELLHEERAAIGGRHAKELERRREQHEKREKSCRHRMELLRREVDKENGTQNRGQAKDAEQADSDRLLRAREEVAEAARANDERMSDLDMRKIRLDQEASRLDGQKAKFEERERELVSEIDNLRSSQQHKESEQAAAQQAAQSAQELSDAMQRESSRKDKLLLDMQKDHQNELDAARRECLEKEKKAAEQQKAQQDLLETARREADGIKEQARKASDMQKALDSRHDELVSSERGLASKQAEFNSRERGLEERERKLEEVQQKQKQRECDVTKRETIVVESRKELSALDTRLNHKDQSLRDKEHELNVERNRCAEEAADSSATQTRERQLTEKAQQLDNQEKLCSKREADIRDREVAVRVREQQANERQGTLTSEDPTREDAELSRSSLEAWQQRLQEVEARLATERLEFDQQMEKAHLSLEKAHLSQDVAFGEVGKCRQDMQDKDAALAAAKQYRAEASQAQQKLLAANKELTQQANIIREKEKELRVVEAERNAEKAEGATLKMERDRLQAEKIERERQRAETQQDNRAFLDRTQNSLPQGAFGALVQDAEFVESEDAGTATASGEAATMLPARLARKSAPEARRGRAPLTARKKIEFPGAADFVTPLHVEGNSPLPAESLKRGRASAPLSTFGQEEAPFPKARAVTPADTDSSRKDSSSVFSRLGNAIPASFWPIGRKHE